MDEILEQIKHMNYDELYRLQDAIGWRMAKLDKYDDIDRQEREEYYESMEEYKE
jgi:hypothetical protein